MNTEEASGDEFEVSEMSRGKKWGDSSNYKCSNYKSNCNFNSSSQLTKPQKNRSGRTWGHKGKYSKITLTQESAHYVPTEFSNNFFKLIDLAMKIKQEELKRQGKAAHMSTK